MSAPIAPEDLVQQALAESWELYRDDFVLYLVAGLLVVLTAAVSLGLLSGPLTVGFIQIVERRRRGEVCQPTDVFDGFSRLGASLLASLLIGLGVFVGLLLFVIPGIAFAFSMAFAFQAIAIENETATGAMARSFEIFRDNLALSIVFVVIVLVLNGIGGSLALFGTLLTLPYCLILLTLAYHRLAPMR